MTDARPHVIVMIPTYNEAENVVPMLEALREVGGQCPDHRFSMLVVDDRSPDGTGELVREYARSHPDVELLSRTREGLGRAMRAGYAHAAKQLAADVIVTLDCDFQWDPLDIPRLLDAVDRGADVAVASRHVEGGRLQGWPLGRRLTHWIANTFFATWVAGTRAVRDHNGNFRAVRARILDRVPLDALPVRGYAFFNWMIYELAERGASFDEIPVTFRWRERGETKVSFSPKYARTFARDTVEYVLLCFRIRAERLTGRQPRG